MVLVGEDFLWLGSDENEILLDGSKSRSLLVLANPPWIFEDNPPMSK